MDYEVEYFGWTNGQAAQVYHKLSSLSAILKHFRTYIKSFDGRNLSHNHLAIINHAPMIYVMASCFTFVPPDKVPIGMSSRVLFFEHVFLS